eukprot:gene1978-biopygen11213
MSRGGCSRRRIGSLDFSSIPGHEYPPQSSSESGHCYSGNRCMLM